MHSNILPPSATELERAVLATIIRNPSMHTSVEDSLNEECFYDASHKVIYSCLEKLHLSGHSGFVPLIQALHGGGFGIEYTKLASELKNEYTSELDFYGNVNVLTAMSIQRQLLHKSYLLSGSIENRETMEVLTNHANDIADIAANQTRQIKDIHLSDSVLELINLLDTPRKGGLSGINTGSGEVNTYTDGWQPSDMIVIGGRPGMGKSVVGLFHTYHAAITDMPVAFISMEMSKVGLTSRIISNLVSIEYGKIMKRDLVPHQKELVKKTANELAKHPIYYYDYSNSIDINDISLTMRSWKRKYGLQMIVIDYVQLLRDRTIKGTDETAIISSVSRKIKQLQSSLDIPIMVLSQLNREVEKKNDKRPTMGDLKQSGQLEQDASTVILLYREDYYAKNQAEAENTEFIPTNTIEYNIQKNRNGETKILTLGCKVQFNRLWDIDPMEPAQAQNYARNEVFNRAGINPGF